jgi:sulfite reductase (NADPH) hemoprotein beta-component
LIGTAYGKYNLHLGGDRLGLRLNRKYRENLDEAEILSELDQLLGDYTREKLQSETFGDYINRKNSIA